MKFSWILSGLLAIGGFFLCILFGTLTTVQGDFCVIYTKFLNEQNYFDKLR
jgi:hypothetical protein